MDVKESMRRNYGWFDPVPALGRQSSIFRLGPNMLLANRITAIGSHWTFIAPGSIAAVVLVHSAFGFHPSFEGLYLLPALVAVRLRSVMSTLLVLAMSAVAATVVAPQGFTLEGLLIRLAIFGIVGSLLRMVLTDRSVDAPATNDTVTPAPQPERQMVAVVVDCQGFETLDEYYGTGAGEHVAGMLANVLKNETRESDMICRQGPHEYVVVLPDVDRSEATMLMDRVQERFSRMVSDAGYECNISFGCSPVETEQDRLSEPFDTEKPPSWWERAYLN
jgi:diguanylate cyclase (GGDEF)-like protein